MGKKSNGKWGTDTEKKEDGTITLRRAWRGTRKYYNSLLSTSHWDGLWTSSLEMILGNNYLPKPPY